MNSNGTIVSKQPATVLFMLIPFTWITWPDIGTLLCSMIMKPWCHSPGIRNMAFPIYTSLFLTAQLGVFGKSISAPILEAFLNSVPKKFRYWDIYFNHQNVFKLSGFRLYQRTNFVLDLNRSYEQIRSAYRENIIRNIRKAEQMGCHSGKGFGPEDVIVLATQQMKTQSKESKENVRRFRALYQFLQENRQQRPTESSLIKTSCWHPLFSFFPITGPIIYW